MSVSSRATLTSFVGSNVFKPFSLKASITFHMSMRCTVEGENRGKIGREENDTIKRIKILWFSTSSSRRHLAFIYSQLVAFCTYRSLHAVLYDANRMLSND